MWTHDEADTPWWMKAYSALIPIMGIPMLAMNIAGGLVAGVWLLFLSEWRILFYGLVSIFSASWVIGLLLAPTLLLIPLASRFEKNPNGAIVIASLSQIYTTGTILIWGFCVLMLFTRIAASRNHPLPFFLWSYEVATGPWAFLASHDQRADPKSNSIFSVYFLSIAYMLALLAFWLGGITGSTAFIIMAVVMSLSCAFQLAIFIAAFREEIEMKNRSPWGKQ